MFKNIAKYYILFFLITGQALAQNNIIGYQYAFNNGNDLTYVAITPTSDFHLQTDIDVSNLTQNINQIHFRFKDNAGQWSGIVSQMFITNPETTQAQDLKITGYEYYYNDDVVNKQFVSVNPQDDFHLTDDLDVTNLPHTINQIHIRFIDDKGQWSSMQSKTFMRNPTVNVLTDNKLVSYEYWVDDDTTNMQTIAVQTPTQDLNILDLDMRMYWRGQHILHSRYKDEQGVYSGATTDTIVKVPYPFSLFDMSTTETCAGETVDFTNNSVDYDTVLWDFGDGNTSTDINPSHIYTQAGTYQINLQITETATAQTDNIQQSLMVNTLPATSISSSLSFPACYDETVSLTADANNMNYLWSTGETTQSIDITNAGTYSVQITNPTTSCQVDSDNVNVTFYPEIDNSISYDSNTYQLEATQANATYQWIDCNNNNNPILGETGQSYVPQQSGNYAVEISMNNCNVISDCQVVTIVGIENNQLDNQIAIYPNPAKQFVTINLESSMLKSYEIFNLAGQKIDSQTFYTPQANNQLSVQNLTNGVYFIKLTNNKGQQGTLRFIKE